MEKFAVFSIGDENFGVGIGRVVEILKSQKIYSLPELPDFLSGVINVRGEVIPLLDLRLRFGIHTPAKKGRMITVRCEGGNIALLVDEIDEIISLNPEDISAPPSIFRGLKTEYLTGLAKKEDKIIILLNLDKLLTSEEKIILSDSSDSLSSANPPESGPKREGSLNL
ncbi:MAG: purine-binding chemotaxis protein CheW [Nitrospirae bacterium]|nr:MAG: purine-binding chemotaxis protein CheW [Nitrospirota bacterium]